jgi:hypothetical protein
LSKKTWTSKAGNGHPGIHPEIKEYLKKIMKLIQYPDYVFRSAKDERSRVFYKLGAGVYDFVGKHLVVIVKYVQDKNITKGYISTMYLSRTIYSKGEIIWPKQIQ